MARDQGAVSRHGPGPGEDGLGFNPAALVSGIDHHGDDSSWNDQFQAGRQGDQGCERSATTESGAASGQRMSFPDYVSAQGPVPILWTPMDPVVFSLLRRAALVDPQRTCG